MADVSVSGGRVRTPVGDAPVIPLILLGTGMYLAWFGVHYWRSDTKWPTDPVKDVLQGKPLPSPDTPAPHSADLTADIQAIQTGSTSPPGSSGGSSGDTGAATQSAQQNQDIAKLLTATYGWSPAQNDTEWNALVKLWNSESGWSNTVQNSGSGAFGIAQALGHGGQGTAGLYGNNYGAEYGLTAADAKSANDGDPTNQVKWGLGYIAAAYGDPVAAWQQEQSAGSY